MTDRSSRTSDNAPPVTAGNVTVVVPTRDRPGLVRTAVESVLRQSFGAPAIVVVDDGSKCAVSLSLAGVQVIRLDEPSGAASARNFGLQVAKTDWVAFLDDDDVWAPDKLRRQSDALGGEPEAGWCYTAALEMDDRGRVLGAQRALDSGWIEDRLLRGNVISGGGSSVLAQAEVLRAAGGFAERVHAGEDWDLWVRLAGRSRVIAVDEPLVAWRRHAGNKSAVWAPDAVAHLERGLRLRANDLNVPFEHTHPKQIRIDEFVKHRERRMAAGAYWERYLGKRAPRDALAAAAVLAAPGWFDGVKRRSHRKTIPRNWQAQMRWIDEIDLTSKTAADL